VILILIAGIKPSMSDGQFVVRRWMAADPGVPAGAEVNALRIIANPVNAEDGQCLVRPVHSNGTLVTRTQAVIDACPSAAP
jgi:hypothetical protein